LRLGPVHSEWNSKGKQENLRCGDKTESVSYQHLVPRKYFDFASGGNRSLVRSPQGDAEIKRGQRSDEGEFVPYPLPKETILETPLKDSLRAEEGAGGGKGREAKGS